ncbi:MAG: aspartate-semialdehyde dehydrogenase [Acidimicrobiia bacterium]
MTDHTSGPTEAGFRVGVIGATGLVGTEILRILDDRAFPVSELRPFASPRSVGRRLPFRGGEVEVVALGDGCFDGLDLVVVDVDDPLAEEWAPVAAAAGARVIDNSAAFRMDPDVPLVIAGVNDDALSRMPKGIASCPNCTTAVLVAALAPLHRAARIRRLIVSTYQSVSGAGQPGVDELDNQWSKGAGGTGALARAGREGSLDPGSVWDRPIAGNVIPVAGSVGNEGFTSEEWKLVRETRKILGDDEIAVSATCVRVPVFVGHAMTANVEFERPVEVTEAAGLLRDVPGVVFVEEGEAAPTPLDSAGIDPVLVGRLRGDPSRPGALNLWVAGDNLRIGAALNAVRIAEQLVAHQTS